MGFTFYPVKSGLGVDEILAQRRSSWTLREEFFVCLSARSAARNKQPFIAPQERRRVNDNSFVLMIGCFYSIQPPAQKDAGVVFLSLVRAGAGPAHYGRENDVDRRRVAVASELLAWAES